MFYSECGNNSYKNKNKTNDKFHKVTQNKTSTTVIVEWWPSILGVGL